MKTLEDKILKKVYRFETKKTLGFLISRIIVLLLLSLTAVIFIQAIGEIYYEERAFDLLALFQEDSEVVRKYFADTLYVFYLETPKVLFFILILLAVFFLVVLLTVVKNYRKIINRIRSFVHIYFPKR